jgi:lysophospholipase L1-like esterase
MISMKHILLAGLLAQLTGLGFAQELEPKPADPYFENFKPLKAPRPSGPMLRKGDRLAIAGDSITEQKMYSRIMETYLTVCVPELDITVRQYGWGGETAPGFLARITNDCLRFKPTIATTCYGMNDHGYRAYEQGIGDRYRKSSTAIVQALKNSGARVIQGSPGCVSHKAEALNLNLCTLRNIGIEIAESEKVGFADVFWPMFTAEFAAHQKYATNYWIAGGDGVHPGWAGHLVMAYAFLKSFGLDGEIGTVTVDLKSGKAEASKGHEVLSAKEGEVRIKSARYPFCATGPLDKDASIRSAMTLVPFNQELNRLILVAKNGPGGSYKVTWGSESKVYSAGQLAKGVNLADDFALNPFTAAFNKVDAAVLAKQNYETHQIKDLFHGLEFKVEPETVVTLTEKCRAPLAEAIKAAFVPVTHTIQIEAN